jgi:hypothetical protein
MSVCYFCQHSSWSRYIFRTELQLHTTAVFVVTKPGGFLQVERLRTVHKVQQIQGGSNMTGTNCDLLTHK